ncbi:MAG: Spy/CpxP family protein refolding chaperone [Leptolyngbyaceae cyanobacterium SM1_1_3]|nr:Spy/CpxP family protein refolding chaperone [Leptolyngbyaceae cyanobacterium SM1_1_3]NJN02945.1 Spy/CpxP family protein refolding chaperone [Leptolyngbyaceae cyanobacterium RM1_1_2]NJO08853.1 Spy/CpxP family protein refolding chaperone [Leptolyngbyaceae cyanobacterium SL_1_1]
MPLRRTVLLSALPLVLLAGGTFALAQSPGLLSQQPTAGDESFSPDLEQRGDRWLEQLDLTSEQSEQIAAIKEQAKTNSEGLRQQLQQQKEAMRSLMASDASADRLRQQHQQMQTLRAELGNQRFETMLAIRSVLTPAQRTQLATLTPEHRGPHGERRSR